MGLSPMSRSSYEPTPLVVGRVSFAPEFDSRSEREAMATRMDPRKFTPAYYVSRSVDLSKASPNPNPRRFEIAWMLQIDKHLVCEVVYPDCTSYEGRKVLVFANTTRAMLEAATVLDPHFTDCAPAGALVPVARFEPTLRGHRLARICAGCL